MKPLCCRSARGTVVPVLTVICTLGSKSVQAGNCPHACLQSFLIFLVVQPSVWQ